jgi:hypothetical protein
MTATVSTHSTRVWTRAHRAALTIAVLAVALAAVLGLLIANLVSDSSASAVPGTSVSGTHLNPTDNGCQLAHPGQPC